MLLLAACTASTDAPTAEVPGRSAPNQPALGAQYPLPTTESDARIRVWPSTAMLPANRVSIELVSDESIGLKGQNMRIVTADGHEVLDAIGSWTWRDERRSCEITPTGLQSGRKYGLLIDGFQTDREEQLSSFVYWFRIGPEDTTGPDAKQITLRGDAKIGTSTPITVHFPEAMHHESVHALAVLVVGQPVEGSWALRDKQTSLVFTPSAPWQGDPFVSLGVSAVDLAGNRLQHRPPGPMPVMVPIK